MPRVVVAAAMTGQSWLVLWYGVVLAAVIVFALLVSFHYTV